MRRGASGLVIAALLLGPAALAADGKHSAGLDSRTAYLASVSGLRAAVQRTVGRSWDADSQGLPTGVRTGFAVAISGSTAVVSAPGANKAGAAYIYERTGTAGRWHLIRPLPDPRGTLDDQYAWAVAISSTKSGTYVAVGGNNDVGQPDIVTIYKGSGKTWHLQATLNDPGPSSQDMFGDSLAISGSTLVVGASCVNNNSGEILIYIHQPHSWALAATKFDPLDRENDGFGQSVAVSGNNVMAGALNTAYIYTSTRGKWPRTAIIRNPGSDTDNFGWSVTLRGTTAVVGAPGGAQGTPVPPPVSPGATYVYTQKGKTWSRQAKLTAPRDARGDEFGFSVALTTTLSNTALIIGMPVFGKVDCGTSFAFAPSGSKWKLRKQIFAGKCTSGDQFGYSVAASGATGIFGAPFTNRQQGAFYTGRIP